MNNITSQIKIVDNIQRELTILEHLIKKDETKDLYINKPDSSNFMLDDAKELIKKVSLASEKEKIVIIAAETLETIAQNAILKTIEERTYIIIIITKYKSGLLPTIMSRLPLKINKKYMTREKLNINLEKLSSKDIYNFLKKTKHKYDKNGAKRVIEDIFLALAQTNIKLNEYDYELFNLSIKAIDLGRPIGSVAGMILLRIKNKLKLMI